MRDLIYDAILSHEVVEPAVSPSVEVVNGSDVEYLGNIAWTRYATGTYMGYKQGAFPKNRTRCFIQQGNDTNAEALYSIHRVDDDNVCITTSGIPQNLGLVSSDGLLLDTAVLIKVRQA
jgi:hypothetical protein